MRPQTFVGSFSIGCLALWACGGGGSDPSPTDGTQSELNNCVPPDSPGNANGVGKYCTKGGFQCPVFGFAKFCTVDFQADAPAFCTNQCSLDSDCGDGAVCTGDGSGRLGCTPVACVPKPDAGAPPPPPASAPDAGMSDECASLARCCAAPAFPADSLDDCQSSVASSALWCELVRKAYEVEGDCPSPP